MPRVWRFTLRNDREVLGYRSDCEAVRVARLGELIQEYRRIAA
jgi:hypothetical protein